jgi:Spy/CpxP family protein refolding chaperone
MTPTIRHAVLAALAAATLAGGSFASSGAWAQQDDHRGPPADARAKMRAQFQAMHEAREKQHAQDLRTILRLRPDQEAALTAYLQSHKRPEGPAMGGRRGPPGGPANGAMRGPMTTPQRLDEMARREAEHTAMRQKHAEALRAFYAALSPEQRQVFDALQRMHGGGHGDGGWGHRGMGGGPGGFGGGPLGGPRGGPPPRDD